MPFQGREFLNDSEIQKKDLIRNKMKITTYTGFSFGGQTELNFNETVEKVKENLRMEGFGVLTEIDVQKTFKQKLDIERNPYMILGDCNPHYAQKAIETEPDIGTLLPCNIVAYQNDNDETVVTAMNPETALNLVNNPELSTIAKEVKTKIEKALQKI